MAETRLPMGTSDSSAPAAAWAVSGVGAGPGSSFSGTIGRSLLPPEAWPPGLAGWGLHAPMTISSRCRARIRWELLRRQSVLPRRPKRTWMAGTSAGGAAIDLPLGSCRSMQCCDQYSMVVLDEKLRINTMMLTLPLGSCTSMH